MAWKFQFGTSEDLSELPNMVKAPMPKKSDEAGKPSRASAAEIKAAIEQAMKMLGLKPERENFSKLAAETGVASSTLYGAYRGDHGLGPGSLHSVRRVARGELTADLMRDKPILGYIPRISWAHAGSLASFEELPVDWQDSVPNTSSDSTAFALTIRGECMSPDYARPGDDVIVTPNVQLSNGCLVVAKLKDGSVLFRKYILLKPDASSFRLDCSNKDAGEDLKMTWKDVIWVYRVHAAMRNFD